MCAMQLRERRRGPITIIELGGRMVINEDDHPDVLRERVTTLVADGHRLFGIDLGGVRQVDTTALAAVVATHLAAVRRDARLVLMRPSKHLRELFEVTGLDRVFTICETEEDAVARLTSSGAAS
jgi:anti-anti-sigma factor